MHVLVGSHLLFVEQGHLYLLIQLGFGAAALIERRAARNSVLTVAEQMHTDSKRSSP